MSDNKIVALIDQLLAENDQAKQKIILAEVCARLAEERTKALAQPSA